jgi:acetyl esterase/lipase
MTDQEIVYQITGMQEVVTRSDIIYDRQYDPELRMDLYRSTTTKVGAVPVVIFVFGYRDEDMLSYQGYRLKDSGQYVSWSRLAAAAGMTAVTYETSDPAADVKSLIAYLRQNADELGIDKDRIGLWACSGNVPTALSLLTGDEAGYLKCAAFFYGPMFDWRGSRLVAEAAAISGFANPCEDKEVDDLSANVPIFLARAGQDYEPLNATIDHFVHAAVGRNLPLCFINYVEGVHGFDIKDDSHASKAIIRQSIGFLKQHLLV